MFRPWLATASFAYLAALGCGERFGDPIVASRGDVTAGGSGSGGSNDAAAAADSGGAADGGTAGEPEATAGAAGSPDDDGPGPTGLCGPCDNSETCGDANDACIRHDGDSFCGRDCDEGRGCPDGYVCVQLDNSRLLQCVPTTTCPSPATTPPSLAQIREYLLARINAERGARGRAPLEPSSCLDQLAQASALDYARSDEPLGKFVKECDPIWPNCSCGWSAQAEVAVAHYGLDWLSAIELALGNPDDRFIESFLDFTVTDAGIGFFISADEAWIALSLR